MVVIHRDLWIFLYILYACSPRWRLLVYQYHTHHPCLALRSAVSLCFRVTQEQVLELPGNVEERKTQE